MKRRLIQSVNLAGQLVIEDAVVKPKSKPRKYVSNGIIEGYIRERNQNWLNDNPISTEELKNQIRMYES